VLKFAEEVSFVDCSEDKRPSPLSWHLVTGASPSSRDPPPHDQTTWPTRLLKATGSRTWATQTWQICAHVDRWPRVQQVYPLLFFSPRWGPRGRKRPPRHAHDGDAELALRVRARRRVDWWNRRHLGAWWVVTRDETVGPTNSSVAQLTPPLACWPIRPSTQAAPQKCTPPSIF
jgi:hypothetical protein